MAIRRRRKPNHNRKQVPKYKINKEILHPEVRVVGENVEQGVYSTKMAIQLAEELGQDLIEISPKANPPVCRIGDYKKFLYERKKKEKELKAKTQKVVVKEIRFTPNTDDHDFEFKLNHAKKFLKDGAKVKAYVQFKGRAILFKDRGELLLLKFVDELQEYGGLEQMPQLEGKRMFVFLNPKKAK